MNSEPGRLATGVELQIVEMRVLKNKKKDTTPQSLG